MDSPPKSIFHWFVPICILLSAPGEREVNLKYHHSASRHRQLPIILCYERVRWAWQLQVATASGTLSLFILILQILAKSLTTHNFIESKIWIIFNFLKKKWFSVISFLNFKDPNVQKVLWMNWPLSSYGVSTSTILCTKKAQLVNPWSN